MNTCISIPCGLHCLKSNLEAPATALRPVTQKAGCFVAGTLVHTKDGLVPIEKIKAGDSVLSQPENQGELSYKRVVNTFQFEDKEVIIVAVKSKEARNEPYAFAVTGNHPFWVKGLGWTRADLLEYEYELELCNGLTGIIVSVSRYSLYRTTTKGVAWERFGGMFDPYGVMFAIHGEPIIIEPHSLNEGIEWWRDEGDPFYHPMVYNFEVEDNHTYYVGELGVWVHSTDCARRSGDADTTRGQWKYH